MFVGVCEFIVGFGVVLVDFQRIQELDGRLSEFALCVKPLPAFEISRFPHVRIDVAPSYQGEYDEDRD
jgi:hypothetical protein